MVSYQHSAISDFPMGNNLQLGQADFVDMHYIIRNLRISTLFLLASWMISYSASVGSTHPDIFSMNPFWIDLSVYLFLSPVQTHEKVVVSRHQVSFVF